ncbi:MAG: Isoleucine patch superfamily protein [Candidatus Methanohalarchaeum thermophilum]|uniref:Isoleucine patch superfamily protein n=1 Tax=Methanohalarchaeum thermophilum TaxID=1903181 RepID=A0A1Q6DTR3_METT1|nr:MAG: Isoleucine patch superfamily protein [Candidatus Methanohalarchaeum thermophilum]
MVHRKFQTNKFHYFSFFYIRLIKMEKHETAYIAPSAVVLGNVKIGKGSSIWPNATIRGDSKIEIGKETNIQDNCVIHSQGKEETYIGDKVTVGHSAVVHAAEVKNESLIGMKSNILNDAQIGKNCIVGASALVPEGKNMPSGTLAIGIPAEVERKLTQKEIDEIKERSREYKRLMEEYKKRCDI